MKAEASFGTPCFTAAGDAEGGSEAGGRLRKEKGVHGQDARATARPSG
jgi:hypothetical protein